MRARVYPEAATRAVGHDELGAVLRGFLGHHGLPDVPLWPEQNDVELGGEHAQQRHSAAQADGETHGGQSHLDVVGGTQVDHNKRCPDNARRVHSEADVLGFVERLGEIETVASQRHVIVGKL